MSETSSSHSHTNRLARESSPYLLQHQHNPVDWYPWGPEAFEKSRKENKPIFLSVGYSTCYWCHVMERQCFENEAVAAEMNSRFVNIKVDREERPDVDQLYMTAVQILTRHGGWPMSVFLTPDLRPFYGGTYFPPTDMHGRPGFVSILRGLEDAYRNRPADVEKTAAQLVNMLGQFAEPAMPQAPITIDGAWVEDLIRRSVSDYDSRFGGFGGAPKFPRETVLELLLVYLASPLPDPNFKTKLWQMLGHTLDAMANGGIRDHLGGGFHRYSTDAQWLVPHFEIMLYDNAMLAWCYVNAFRQTREQRYADVARGIFDFILREMTSPAGAFYTALDAEVDSQEGLNYLWTAGEIEAVLGAEDARIFNKVYGVDRGPNFADPHHGSGTPDKNILFLPQPLAETAVALMPGLNKDRSVAPPAPSPGTSGEGRGEGRISNESANAPHPIPLPEYRERGSESGPRPGTVLASLESHLAPMRLKLYESRQKRKQPLLDTKIITSWNALMIRAFAHGGKVLGDSRYLAAAEEAAGFILDQHRMPDGGLFRTSRDGAAKYHGFLDDYAFFIQALLAIADATGSSEWKIRAAELADVMTQKFADPDTGGYYFSEKEATDLIIRQKTASDSPLPSGSAVAAMALLDLGQSTASRAIVATFANQLESQGEGMSAMVQAAFHCLRAVGPFTVTTATDSADDRPLSPEKTAQDVVTTSTQWRTPTELVVHLSVRGGFHINAHDIAAEMKLIPTALTLADAGATVQYPPGEELAVPFSEQPLRVYSGEVTLTVSFASPPDAGGTIELSLTYQACDESACLPPVTKRIVVAIEEKVDERG